MELPKFTTPHISPPLYVNTTWIGNDDATTISTWFPMLRERGCLVTYAWLVWTTTGSFLKASPTHSLFLFFFVTLANQTQKIFFQPTLYFLINPNNSPNMESHLSSLNSLSTFFFSLSLSLYICFTFFKLLKVSENWM